MGFVAIYLNMDWVVLFDWRIFVSTIASVVHRFLIIIIIKVK